MATWAEIEADAPEFAGRVSTIFSAGTNKTIATLRSDGAPRISGLETEFVDGQITFGMMGDSMKLADVRRDPRIAIHSPTLEPEPQTLPGDAKLAGRAVEIDGPDDGDHAGAGFFRLDVTEVVITSVADDLLVVETWHPAHGYRRRTRA